MGFALSDENKTRVDDLIQRYPNQRAALIPLLWICQEQQGWVSPEVIDFVAARLELSTAVVKGVVTFYTMFFEHPVGENVVWVCRTLSCDLRGGKAIQDHMEQRFGCHAGETSADGKFTLLKAECLAACGQAPMVQINDRYYEDLNIETLDAILDAHLKEGAEVAAKRYATQAAVDVPVEALTSTPPPLPDSAKRTSNPPPIPDAAKQSSRPSQSPEVKGDEP